MRDSVAKRVLWFIIFLLCVLGTIYGSFFWSLGQTIRFTNLITEDGTAGIIFGFLVQFLPTAFIYMATSYDKDNPDENNYRMIWMTAFWIMSLFDAGTNIGARFDRLSVDTTPPVGFVNAQYAQSVEIIMIVLGVALDFLIVFAEELLGHLVGIFFDNLGALITLRGGRPPKWFAMVRGVGRAVGGVGAPGFSDFQNMILPNSGQDKGRNKSNRQSKKGRPGLSIHNAPDYPGGERGRDLQNPRNPRNPRNRRDIQDPRRGGGDPRRGGGNVDRQGRPR